MKSLYIFLLSFLVFLMVSTQAGANKVVVKGTVKFTNGSVAANWPVYISTDIISTSTVCRQEHKVYTNANGFYVDTLNCPSNIIKVRIYTVDCNNAHIVHDPQVSPGNVVESNFVICSLAMKGCEAAFTIKKESNALAVRLNSSNAHGATSIDKITRRRWKFGDGDTLGGNIVDPAHTYSKKGVYQACLTIWTAAGCENTACATVTITENSPVPPAPAVQCTSKIAFEVLPASNIAGVAVRFNSKGAVVAHGDSIRERIWKFGDGKTATTADPLHTYTTGGTYNACLIIRSVKGCSDTACVTIQLPNTEIAKCQANFSATTSGKLAKFTSVSSQSSPGDIISRRWDFGDNQILEGNIKDPQHEYKEAGTYTICLSIKTSRGCESKECKKVVIPASAYAPPIAITKCKAVFTYESISTKKIRFNSSKSSAGDRDSIVARKWDFGVGPTLASFNESNPAFEYSRPGVYTVCLQIKTKSGCESKYCTTVRIAETTPVTTASNEYIKIVSLHPNPVVTPLRAEVWSYHNNITAELSIYDIYGVKKFSISKILLQGTNITSIPTGNLLPGPYFLRVTTMYGVKSVQFYKL